jgi:hypothetical protein
MTPNSPKQAHSVHPTTTNAIRAASLLLVLLVFSISVGCQGFSAGGNNTNPPPPGSLTLGSTSLSFGSVTAGSTKTLSVTATNLGSSAVNIKSATVSGSGFAVTAPSFPMSVAVGQSATLSVAFTPNTAGTFKSDVTILSDASDPSASVALSGTGITEGQLSSNPASEAFGNVLVGSQQSASATITNTGATSVSISQAAISGAGFTLSAISTPLTLTAGQSTTLTVTFSPQSPGAATGTVTLTSNGSNPTFTIPLSGTGITAGQLTSNPSSKAFGSVTVGTQQTATATITNTGGSSVTISQVSVTGAGFSVSGLTTPKTLAAGQSTALTITFAPQAAGASSGSVMLASDAANPTLTVPLSGTGVTAGQLASSPTSETFGSVTVGNLQNASVTLTNTGGASATISQASASGTGFSISGIATPATLSAGQSTSFTVTFTPQSSGATSGAVTITSNASNPTLTIPLSGTGVTPGQLTSNPTSESFGSVTVGSQQSATETVTNTGGTSVTISQVAASGTGFSISGITTPKTLSAGQSTSFSVTFAPQAAGAVSGNVTVTSNAPNPALTIPLSGTGASPQAGQLSVSPTTLNLGSVTVSDSGTASGSLLATGASVTVTAATTNNSAFTVSGLSLPVTIPAGQSAPFTITFSPLAAGSASATLTITSNAQTPSTTAALSGTGVAQATHSVNLSWTASTSTDVAGYNVYRALYASSACGTFSKINSVLTTSTVYTDSTVANSTSYCYATTAVDTSNQESSYSNVVSNVAVP